MRIISAHIQFIYKTYKKTDVFISEDVPYANAPAIFSIYEVDNDKVDKVDKVDRIDKVDNNKLSSKRYIRCCILDASLRSVIHHMACILEGSKAAGKRHHIVRLHDPLSSKAGTPTPHNPHNPL